MRAASGFLVLLLLPLVASASQLLPFSIDPHSRILFQAKCLMGDSLPPTGMAPLEVTIRNDSSGRGSWTLDFNSATNDWSSRGRSAVNFSTTIPLAVEAGAQRTFHFCVPYASGSYSLQCSVQGSGFDYQSVPISINRNAASAPGPFLGLSDTLGAQSTELLKPLNARFTVFAPAELPDDWRALTGFDTLWLGAGDLGALAAGQRLAIQEWLARGGVLFLFGVSEVPPAFSETGFGRVVLHASDKLDAAHPGSVTADLMNVRRPRDARFTDSYSATWAAAQRLGSAALHIIPLSLLLVALAMVNGPVNLYFFASDSRRGRLLWTTPLISIAATLCLGGYIFVQDGFGGFGERYALIHLLPGQNKEAILQEQISRTGVAFSRSFHLAHPGYVMPIAPAALSGPGARTFVAQGQDYSGDWLSSRTRQGEWIETVVPTRAELRLLNPSGPEPPAIVSSIEAPLEEVFLRTEDGKLWHAAKVHAGEKRTLEPASNLPSPVVDAGAELTSAWAAVSDRKGYFYAITEASAAFEETFTAVRWARQRAVYLGPVSQPHP